MKYYLLKGTDRTDIHAMYYDAVCYNADYNAFCYARNKHEIPLIDINDLVECNEQEQTFLESLMDRFFNWTRVEAEYKKFLRNNKIDYILNNEIL